MLADPELREALYCIRCGACLNACPVYGKVGGHAYGWVYPGPIGAVVTPSLVGVPRAKDLPFASTLCGACRDVCPLKIDIPRMLLKLRSDAIEGAGGDAGAPTGGVADDTSVAQDSGRAAAVLAGGEGHVRRAVAALAKGAPCDGCHRRSPAGRARGDFPRAAMRPFRARWRKDGSSNGG